MKDDERRKRARLRRVREFGVEHAASFPQGSAGGEQFAVVAEVVEELDRHAAAQASGTGAARQGSALRAAARATLCAHLRAISRTARALAVDAPEVATMFRLGRIDVDKVLLSTAHAFLTLAEPLKADFIRHELPADFLAALQAAIESFERAVVSQNMALSAHVGARAAINVTLARGLKAVQRLDAVVRNKFHDDPATVAAWTSARHVERAPRRKETAPPPDQTAAPPPPAQS